MHWSAVSDNPNLQELLNLRALALDKARGRPVRDRIEYLCGLARGKRVLDVGVVNHIASTAEDSDWLHGRLAAVAGYCFGVDVVADGIRELRAKGFNVAVCDITSDDLQSIAESFDLGICGELIEHLGNPGALFNAARQLLVPGGRLVLTTPNPFYLGRLLRHLFNASRENVDHVTMLFPSGIAEFADRAGLGLRDYRGLYPQPVTVKRKLFLPLKWIIRATMNDEATCESLIYECERDLNR
jgi:2-polyprenyl-3-methyl-5-hydroxy-6-metoxy-1,4-benzoquinol methylase